MSYHVLKHGEIIPMDTRTTISARYKTITKAVNREFWNSISETAHSLYVGSYGRGTAIGTSDIDILFELPRSEYDRYDIYKGNGQSRLLQAVKTAIQASYPRTDVRADGQVVKVSFADGMKFEVLPAFASRDWYGNMAYQYPDSNMGGNWRSTNPKAEQDAMRSKNDSDYGLLFDTCKHMRYIRDNYFSSYHLSGIVIDSFVYLINTVLFDAEWESIYKKDEISDSTFTALDGTKRTISMMYSTEQRYLDDGKATGFIKPYKSGYSFVALLPNGDISLSDYVASMTGKSFVDTIKNAKDIPVETAIPKFSYDYDIEMGGALKALGMTNPFEPSKADFSALGSSDSGNIFISRVLHKAYIAVDERGTKAGAATAVETVYTALEECIYRVTLDRPFVYAIIDDATGLPVFIGTVTDIGK